MRLLGGNSFWKAGHFWYPAVRFQGCILPSANEKLVPWRLTEKHPWYAKKWVKDRWLLRYAYDGRFRLGPPVYFLQMFVGFSIRGWYKDILYLDDPLFGWSSQQLALNYVQEISYVGPTAWTPKKLEYLYSSSCNLLRGPLVRSYLFFDGPWWS